MRSTRTLGLLIAIGSLAASLHGQPLCAHQEIEPNGAKAQATAITITSGQALCGDLSNPFDVDFWRIKTAPAAPGIYRHVLTESAATFGIIPSIIGLDQVNGVIVSGASQALANAPPPAQQSQIAWYGFGGGEEIYVAHLPLPFTQFGPYAATLMTTPVTPAVIGPFVRGGSSIEFSTLPTSLDTELWLYRVEPGTGKIAAVPDAGNDDALSGGPGSRFTRFLPLGRYLMVVGLANMANNLRSLPRRPEPQPAGPGLFWCDRGIAAGNHRFRWAVEHLECGGEFDKAAGRRFYIACLLVCLPAGGLGGAELNGAGCGCLRRDQCDMNC